VNNTETKKSSIMK